MDSEPILKPTSLIQAVMGNEPLLIQLNWEDPSTGEFQHPRLAAPIAIGREKPQIPDEIDGQRTSKLELSDKQVSRFHSLITVVNGKICVTDHSANGTFLNGQRVRRANQTFSPRETLRIGPYKITASLVSQSESNSTELNLDQTIGPSTAAAPNNMMFTLLIGGLVLVLAGAGAWFLVTFLLENSRPDADPDSAISGQQSVVSDQWSVVSDQWSVVSGQRSAISGQRSAISGQRSAISGQRSVVSGQRSVVSGQRSVVSGQRSVITTEQIEN